MLTSERRSFQADLVVRHLARVPIPPLHPLDSFLDDVDPLMTLDFRPQDNRLINLDAHIPEEVRTPMTLYYIDYGMARISPYLRQRPSNFLQSGWREWACPHGICTYTILLDNLDATQEKTLLAATSGAQPPAFEHEDGAAVVDPSFARQAVDIIALAHYEQHFAALAIRHVTHGQARDGMVSTECCLPRPVAQPAADPLPLGAHRYSAGTPAPRRTR